MGTTCVVGVRVLRLLNRRVVGGRRVVERHLCSSVLHLPALLSIPVVVHFAVAVTLVVLLIVSSGSGVFGQLFSHVVWQTLVPFGGNHVLVGFVSGFARARTVGYRDLLFRCC